MNSRPQVPDWLVPGAEVVTWYPFARASHSVNLSKVKKVADFSFSLEDGREPRYKINTLDARVDDARVDGGWSTTDKHVAHADSAEGVYWIAVRDEENYLSRADSAVVTWQRERTWLAAADLQHALGLWIAGSEYLANLTKPRRT